MGATRINAISAKKRYRISCKDLYRSPRREDAYARLPRHAELFELISPARKRWVSGTASHVYLLLVLPAETALADAVRTLKANSSRWMRERSPSFAWQQGYGAFSVSPSQLHRVKRYIANQPCHHGTHSFEQEFLAMLQAANIRVERQRVPPLKGLEK